MLNYTVRYNRYGLKSQLNLFYIRYLQNVEIQVKIINNPFRLFICFINNKMSLKTESGDSFSFFLNTLFLTFYLIARHSHSVNTVYNKRGKKKRKKDGE